MEHLLKAAVIFMVLFFALSGCPREQEEETPTIPTVSSCTPSDDATEVTKNTTVVCTFSEAMDATTLTTSSVTLTAEGSSVSGTVAVSEDGTQVTFTPSSALSPVTSHTLTLSTDVKDTAGTPLASAFMTDFTTMCSASDDFGTDNTLTCFSLYRGIDDNGYTAENFPGTFYSAITILNGSMTLSHNTMTTENSWPALVKSFTGSSFEVELVITAGLPLANEGDEIWLIAESLEPVTNVFAIAYGNAAEGPSLSVSNEVNNVDETDLDIPLAATSSIFLKITRSGTTYTAAYKTSSADSYTTVLTKERDGASDPLGGSNPLAVGIITDTAVTTATSAPQIDAFNVLSGTIEGQE